MKYVVFVCEGMADEPLDDLNGRTPLEVAKKPNIDALAKKSKMGRVLFVPPTIHSSSDVGCMAILGYDPKNFYTGIAPLEAVARGIDLKDDDVVFRCDLVTVSDDTLVDNRASVISPREAKLLVEELNKKLSDKKIKFYPGDGYKNLLVISDPDISDHLDELECASPRTFLSKKYTDHLPKGVNAPVVIHLMTKSREILENHEINRVRIDLKENPANMIWPWGQGKRPRLPMFKDRLQVSGAIVSDASFMKGLAKSTGLDVAKSFDSAISEHDFALVYKESISDIYRYHDVKTKIKLIEEFDVLIGEMIKKIKTDARILVTSDYPSPLRKVMPAQGQVPFLISGSGVEADEYFSFNEKVASQSKIIYEDGYKLIEYLLKNKA